MPRQKIAWLFTGDRLWPYHLQPTLEEKLDSLGLIAGPGGDLVIHGEAAGFDSAVDIWARRRGHMIARVPYPNWRGRSAKAGGPLRNQQMIEIVQGLTSLGYNCRGVVGHNRQWTIDKPHSGTADCAKRMKMKGFVVKVIRGNYGED